MQDIKLRPDQGFVLDRHPLLTHLCFQKPSGIEEHPEFQEGLKQRLETLYGDDIKPDYQYVKLPEDKDEVPPFQLQFIQLINGYIALLNQLKSQELKVDLKILQGIKDSKQLEPLQQAKMITELQARELRLLLHQRENIKKILTKIAKDDYFLQPAEKIKFYANLKRKLENLLHYLTAQYADNADKQIHSRIAMTLMQFADAFDMCTEGINAAVMEAYNKWLIADDIPGWVYQKLESVAVKWAAQTIRKLGATHAGTDSHVVSAALRAAHVLRYGIEPPTNKDNYPSCENYYKTALAELDAEYRREFSYETLCMHIYETQLGKCRQWLADFTRERLTQSVQALRTLNKNMRIFTELKICNETDLTIEDEEEAGCYQLHPKLAALLPVYCALYSLQRLLDLGLIEDINSEVLKVSRGTFGHYINYAGIEVKVEFISETHMFHGYLTGLLLQNKIFRFIHISQNLSKNESDNEFELTRIIAGWDRTELLVKFDPLRLVSSSFACDSAAQEIIVPLLLQHPDFKKNPRSLLARSVGDKLTYGIESVNDRVTLNTFKFFWSFLIEQVERKALTQKELVDFVGARDSKGFTLITNKKLSQLSRGYDGKILWLLSQIKGIITYQDELSSTDVRVIVKIFDGINKDNYHPDRFFKDFRYIFSSIVSYYRGRFQEELSLIFAIIAKQCDVNLKHLSFFKNLLSLLRSIPLNFSENYDGNFSTDLVETLILLREYIEFDLHNITLEHDQKDEAKIDLPKLTLLQTAILETNAQVVQQLLAIDEKISIGHDDLCIALKEIKTIRRSFKRSFLRNTARKIAILQTLMHSKRVDSTIQYSELLPLAVAAEAAESKIAPAPLASFENIIDLVFLPLTDESRRKPPFSKDTALQWGGIAAQLITLKKCNIFLQILFKIPNITFSPIYDILDFSSKDDEKTASIDPDTITIKKLIRLLAIIRDDESQHDTAKELFLELVLAASQPPSPQRGMLCKQLLYTRLLDIVAQQCCGEKESKHVQSFYQQLATSEYDIRRRLILHRYCPALDLSQAQKLRDHGKPEFRAETPLRAAIRWGDDSLFQELIQAKAQRSVIVDGDNALHCLLEHAHEFKEESSVNNILAALIVDAANFGDSLDERARQEIVINLTLITAKDKYGETALHLAAARNCPAATFKHLWDNANDYCKQLREDKATTTTVPDLKRLVGTSIKASQPSLLHYLFVGEDKKQYQIQKLLLVCSRINLLEELFAYTAEFSPLSRLDSRKVLLLLFITLHNKQPYHAAVYVKIFCNLLIQKKLALTLDDILTRDTDWYSKEGFGLPKLLDILRMQGFAAKDIFAPAPLLQISSQIERQEFSQAKSRLDDIIASSDSKSVIEELDLLQILHDTDLNPLSSQRLDEFYRYILTIPSTSLIPNQEIVLLSIIANKNFLNALMCVVCANNLSALEWLLSSPTTKPVREKSLLTRDTTLPLLLAAEKTGYAIFKKLLHYLRQNLIRKEWQELFIPESKEHFSILHEACMQALSTNQWGNIQLLLDEYSKLFKQDALPKLCQILVAQMNLVDMAKTFAKFYTESIILPTDLILVLRYLKSVIKFTGYRQFCSILCNQLSAYPFIYNDHTLIVELLNVTGFNHEKMLTHDTILYSATRLSNYEICEKILAAIASCEETPEAKQQFIDYINPLHDNALLAAINRKPKDEKIVKLLQTHSSPAARAYCQVKTAAFDEKLTPDLLALALHGVIKQNKYVAALSLWQKYTEKYDNQALLAILTKLESIPDDKTPPVYLGFYQHIAAHCQPSDFFNGQVALIARFLFNNVTCVQLIKECKESVKINSIFKELLKQARITQSIDEDEVRTIVTAYQALLKTGKVDYDPGLFKRMFSQFLLYSVKQQSFLDIRELLQSYQKNSGFPPQVELNAVLDKNRYHRAIAHFPECLAELCDESTSETILKIIKSLERFFATEDFRELCWQLLKRLGATVFQFPSHSLARYLLGIVDVKCVTQVLDEKTGDTALTFAAQYGDYSLCNELVGGYIGASFEPFVDRLNNQNKTALILATEQVAQDAKKIRLLQGLSSQPAITYCQIKTSPHSPEIDVDSKMAMYEWLLKKNYQRAFTDLFNTADFTQEELKIINNNRLLESSWLDAVNSTLNTAVQLRTEQKTEYKISGEQLSKEQYVFKRLLQSYKILEETTSVADANKIRTLYEQLLTIQQLDDNSALVNDWLLEAIRNNGHEIIPLFFLKHKLLVDPNHQDPRSEQTLIFVLLNQIAQATSLLEMDAAQKSLSFIVRHANWDCGQVDSKGRTALERSINLDAPTFKSILDHSSDDVLTKSRADHPSKTILDDLLEQKCNNDVQKIEGNTKLHYFLTTLWDRFAIGNKSLSRMNPKGQFYAIKVKQLTKIANLIVQYYIHCKSQIPRAQLSFFTRRAPGDQLSLSEWQATAGQLQHLLQGKTLNHDTRNYSQRIARIPEFAAIHQFFSRYLSTAIDQDFKMRIT